ncbi:MAG: hypothetical protein AB7F89_08385 [Pirellulaceae bacterium]
MQLLNTTLLIALAGALVAGNLWYSAARSLIPLALADEVRDVEVRREKHPGRDDVHLLTLRDGRVMHIDQAVATKVFIGSQLAKEAWSHELRVDDGEVALSWSDDFRGMRVAMPLVFAIVVATAAGAAVVGACGGIFSHRKDAAR